MNLGGTVDSSKLTDAEMQARLIYSVFVAGKTAKFADTVTRRLIIPDQLPFDTIASYIQAGTLESVLRASRVGNYGKMTKCFPELIKLNPRTCTVEELESIHGVGPKTARFFLLWTGRKIKCAALDTHVLKFLRDLGYKVPKNTPSGMRYAVIEQLALAEADKRNLTPNDFDWLVWDAYSRKDGNSINKLLTMGRSVIDYQI